jgi:hypothetical protein
MMTDQLETIGIDWATKRDVFVLHCPEGDGHSEFFETWAQVPAQWICTCGRVHQKPTTSAIVAGLL